MTDFIECQVPLQALIEAIKQAGIGNRLHEMVNEYGEITSRNKAMKMLHCGDERLDELIAAGKVRTACEGTFIDTRSICQYIERKAATGANKGRYRL